MEPILPRSAHKKNGAKASFSDATVKAMRWRRDALGEPYPHRDRNRDLLISSGLEQRAFTPAQRWISLRSGYFLDNFVIVPGNDDF